MQTIRIRVSDAVYKNLMWFLGKFTKDELQIIEEDKAFISVQAELKDELQQAENNPAKLVDLERFDEELEATIRKHES